MQQNCVPRLLNPQPSGFFRERLLVDRTGGSDQWIGQVVGHVGKLASPLIPSPCTMEFVYKSSISSGNLSILYSIAYHTLQKLMYRDVKQGERPRRDLGPQPKVPESRPKIAKVFWSVSGGIPLCLRGYPLFC